MLRIDAKKFYQILNMLTADRTYKVIFLEIKQPEEIKRFERLNRSRDLEVVASLDTLQTQLKSMSLPMSAKSLDKVKAVEAKATNPDPMIQQTYSLKEDFDHLWELNTRLLDELEGKEFLVLPPESVEMRSAGAAWFGVGVSDAFPEVREDLSEACNCFVLERYTASIFHLMRTLEVVVLKLGAKLQVTVQSSDGKTLTWGVLLQNIKAQGIDRLAEGPEKDRWLAAFAYLGAVKDAWRNTTMHPKQTYSEEEADGIFRAIRPFLQKLTELAR